MATTIKSTSLDFNAIKSNLKTFLAQQSEFADYNFEASGLSNILDVLAYNTHYNGLTANFALNESYLGTAQLRSSLVSLAEGIGYVPKSRTASRGLVTLSIDLTALVNRPTSVTLPTNARFTSSVDNVAYSFQTREELTSTDDGSGIYKFKRPDDSNNIGVYEGSQRTKTFIAEAQSENSVYVIPDEKMDITTAVVRVYETASSNSFVTYSNIQDAILINSETALYILKESPNGYYEITFGDGVTLGRAPKAGYKIEIDYLSTAGPAANEAKVFTPVTTVNIGGTAYPLNVQTISDSIGGDIKESIESIRKNAPFQYATQNRMVTSDDYASLVLRNFSTLIKDISSFGGEDALEPEFGAVYMSIVFEDDVDAASITVTQDSIQELVDQLSVVSFRLKFVDPIKTFVETNVYFQFNPKLSTESLNSISTRVNTTIASYFSDSIGKFGQSFRRSNLLTKIDDVSPAVLSSRMDVKMQQRITPSLDKKVDYSLRYPTPIAISDDVNYIVDSTTFVIDGKICKIRNRLKTNVLEVFAIAEQEVVIDNIGSYDASKGTLDLVGFTTTSIIGNVSYIKISVTPANQSAISPLRQDILEYDEEPSFSSGVIVTST
jgi:hypothetical protein